DPGGICISRNAYDHIKDKLKLGYEYLGQHEVKNIKDPVRVYKVLSDPEDAGKLIGEEPQREKKKWILPVVMVATIVVVAIVWHFYQSTIKPDIEPATIEKMAYQLPDKPSIAVLAFDNLSGDPEQEYFSDGLSEEIITALSKSTQIFVIARNSSFTYKGKPVKVQRVSEELGVRYVLEGSVRKDTNRVRITAQLIDAVKGIHLWAERYDRELKDIFAIQDDITKQIIAELHVKLTIGESSRVIARTTNSLDAYLKYLQAREEHFKFTKEGNHTARRLVEEAISKDPENGMAYTLLGATHMLDVHLQTTDSPKKSLDKAIELQQKAIALGAYAHHVLGFIYSNKKLFDKAIAECQQAVELGPNYALARTFYGLVLIKTGRFEEAVNELEQGLRLDPFASSFTLRSLALAYNNSGRSEDAIAMCKKATQKAPNDLIARIICIQAYSSAGRQEEAEKEATEVLRINPKFHLKSYEKRAAYKNKADTDRMITVLRKAGLPYTPPLPLPDKPSIAVLAFENMSEDRNQEYFSDGLSEEIITSLSKTDQLFVIARNSTFTYKGKPVNVKQIARELGVRYVLEGSVRKSKDRVRITAQLIDATTGHHLWSERYDRDLKDIFALQDEITMKIVTALQVKLTEGEHARMWGKKTGNLDLLLKRMELLSLWRKGTRESHMKQGQLAQELIDMAPESPNGYRALAWYYWYLSRHGKSPRKSITKAFKLAQKAISLDVSDADSHGLLGSVYLMMRKYEKAIAAGERSIELEPNGAMYHGLLGLTLSYAGRPDEAIVYLKKGIRLNPFPAYWYFLHLNRCYILKGQYEDALITTKKALHRSPDAFGNHIFLAINYALLDRKEEADVAVKKVLELWPSYSVKRASKKWPYKNQADIKLFADAMRKAGLPE
ncbi:MAG: tetratricopeptide repeat protein, partial [Deltaproteobacteria bacterium]|nr:tetratricopeptide repeat protein [Deltaproteobacteria bacterium]